MTQNQAYAIEVSGRSAGIVVAERRGVTFFAADRAFQSLDRHTFRRVIEAERAARQVLATRVRV